MVRRRTVPKSPTRPVIPINWAEVDRLIEADCTAISIAGYLGCCVDTLYARCLQEKGIMYSVYAASKRSTGECLLRAAQMKTALKGNPTLLIWLGKNRLNQRDDPITETSFNGLLAATLDEMKKQKPQATEVKEDDESSDETTVQA